MGRTTKRAVTREEPESHCHAPRKWVESTLVRKSAPVVNNPPTSCSFSCHGSVEKSGEDRSSHSFDGQPTMSVEPNLDIDGFKDHEEFFAALEKHKYAQMEVNQQNPTIAEKTTRRQGSGRRRPVKYRHLPSNGASSQQILIDNVPILNLESILDIEDPEEFFSALEKQENAERERRKQMGIVSLDLYPQSPSRTARSRRPKTWKSVKNKYSYSNVVSSQETLVENVPGPSDCGVQHETTNPDVSSEQKEISHDELQETELDGSIRVSRLLDKLLPKNGEELDKNEAITLIKEHVQFEPIDVGKSCFPELEDVPRIDFRALEAKLPKPRNSLSEDKQNMLNLHGIRTQIQKKHSQAESSVPSSPTPPRNPMDSIISLKKLQSDPKKRCFSFSELDIDQSPPRNASPFESVTKQTEEVNMEKDLTIPFKISSPVIEENDTAHVNMSLPGVAIGLTSSSDETGKDNFNRLGSGIDVGSSGFHVDFEDNVGGSDMDNMVLDEVVGKLDTDTEVQTNEPNEADKMEDIQQEAVEPDLNMEDSNVENLNSTQSHLGSIRVSRLLDKLLPKNGEELDKNEAITLIKEHVQFEPIDVGKSCFPELEDVPRIDFRALEAKLPKPRNSLSEDKQNMLNLHGIRTQIQKKHSQAESSVPSSPTPPRNPMDSIISLKKLQSDPKKRCFSFSELDIDQSPPRNASPFESVTKQTEEVNMEKDLTIPFKISSPVIEENDTAHVNMSLPGVAIGLTSSSDETGKDNFNRLGSGIDVGSSGFHVDFKDNFGGSDMDNMVLDEVVGRLDADTEVQTNEPNEADKMEDIQQEAVEPDLNMEDSNVENLNSTQSHLDQSAVVEEHVMDGPSNTAGTGPEQHKEEPQTPTRVSSILESEKISRKRRKGNDEGTRVLQNEPSETRSRPQKKGCGTSRDTAMRRSTRVKWKPLKFWEGEKLISARIIGSETLTVVGRIYLSPSEDTGSPTLTVESLVSDEYKDLVEDAARH